MCEQQTKANVAKVKLITVRWSQYLIIQTLLTPKGNIPKGITATGLKRFEPATGWVVLIDKHGKSIRTTKRIPIQTAHKGLAADSLHN